jgi:hypothetical protein
MVPFDWQAVAQRPVSTPTPFTPSGWCRTSRAHPCPICGHPDWCTFTRDGAIACCMRVDSPRRAENGGHIHRIEGHAMPRLASVPAEPTIDVEAEWRRWEATSRPYAVAKLAECIGVTEDALVDLGAAWSGHGPVAFPMRNERRQVIGIRLREPVDAGAKKWAVKGTRAGLFIPRSLPDRIDGPLVVAEGPTDVAALLDLGMQAIGRHACVGQAAFVQAVVAGLGSPPVVVFADADGPGTEGALRLAAHLVGHAPWVKVIAPPADKDARAWVRRGATRGDVERRIAAARTQRKGVSRG